MSTSPLPDPRQEPDPFRIETCRLEITAALSRTADAMGRFRDSAASGTECGHYHVDYLTRQLHESMNGLMEVYVQLRFIQAVQAAYAADAVDPDDDDDGIDTPLLPEAPAAERGQA